MTEPDRTPAARTGTGISLPWTALLVCAVIVQTGTTMLFPDQRWSMPVGLGFIIACCAVIVLRSMPAVSPDRWCWQLIALGLFFWSGMFVALAYEANYPSADFGFSSILGGMKQICFIIVLLPSSSKEGSMAFRLLDLLQSGLFITALTIFIWGSIFRVSIDVNEYYIYISYITMAVFAILSYFEHSNQQTKEFLLNIVILTLSYAAISIVSSEIGQNYALSGNSIIWVIGDISFLIYGIRSTALKAVAIDTDIDRPRSTYRRHLPPVILTILLLLLAFDMATRNIVLGATLGILGMLSYVVRTTLLLDCYLAARDTLIAAERQHARLLIDMIHEIRAPLGSMVLNASMLQRASALPAQQAGWIEQIAIGGARVTTMLNDVLQIERIDAGLAGADLRPCDLMPIVRRAVAVVTPQAADAAIAIAVDDVGETPVRADCCMLERVLVNLLTNAVRFTPEGGRIAITLDDGPADMIVVRVRDQGVGIAPDRLATLFDRFSHIGVPLRGHRGSGLGLSICQGLMSLMGGRIAIDSIPGEGTVATLHIPRAIGPSSPHETGVPSHGVSQAVPH